MKTYPFPDNFRDAMALPDGEFKRLFGKQVVKGWHDLKQIEAFLSTHSPKLVIEVGTGDGIHTLYLGIWAALHGASVTTYDPELQHEKVISAGYELPISWSGISAWHDTLGVSDELTLKIRPVLLYCDNGDKPREVQTFAPLLKPGDWLIVHDWNHEVFPKDVEPLIENGTLAYFERDVWERTGTHMGFYRPPYSATAGMDRGS